MAQEIQTLQAKETLDITQKQGGWLGAMTQLATSPNAIAEFGVQMASNASQTYQTLRGVEAGKNPSNSLLPPVTKADEAFVKGYSAQAEQTLGLQAQQLINQAELDLNKNYKLNNGQIQSYTENVSQGLQKIIEQAPYTIRSKLANQYNETLQRTTFSLNNKLLSQQKQESKENAGLFVKNQMRQMTDAIMTGQGNPNTVYQNSIDYINNKQASGMWSPAEAETQRQTLKQLFLNNSLSKGAIDSYNNKDLESYLSSLTNKPAKFGDMNISYDEWETARNHALSEIVNYERFTSSEQNLLVSDAKIKYAEQGLSQTQIDDLKQQLQPQKFNELYGWMLGKQSANLAKQERITELLANNSNIDVMARATPKEIDATYDATVKQLQATAVSKGTPLSDEDAQFQAISTIPTPVPAVNNMLRGQLLNGDAATAIRAASQIKRIEDADLSGRLDSSFQSTDNASSKIAHSINQLLPFSRTPDEAVAMARQIAFPTEEQKNASLELAQKFKKKNGTAAKKIEHAKSLVNVPNSSQVVDKSSFYINVSDAYADALEVFGNESLAKSWVQKGIDQNYGTTTVNGTEQFTFMPIEKMPGLGKNAVPVIQQDIYNDVSKYVANMKSTFDQNKNLGFYYELEPRKNYNEFAQAVIDPKAPNAKETINEFLAAKPIKITKVYRNTGERVNYTLEVRSGPFASLGTHADMMASGYDYILRNEKGAIESFHGTFGNEGRIPFYSPDTKYIKEATMTIQQATKQNYEVRLKKYLEDSKGLRQQFSDIGLLPGEGLAGIRKIAARDEMALENLGGPNGQSAKQ
jgi:hypothetical protein